MSAARGESDEEYYARIQRLLEDVYLAADNPVAQSGLRGDLARWERLRRPIAEGIDRDGTFLDIGCANGLLLESLVPWAAARGFAVEPYGLDLSPRLAELARRRLPRWAEQVYVGNVMTWEPPRRFDFARTELVYVPEARRADLVGRLLARVVAPGGRLLVCSYGSVRRDEPSEDLAALLTSWGCQVAGMAEACEDGVVVTRVAWVEA